MNSIKWQSLATNAFYTLIFTQTFRLSSHFESVHSRFYCFISRASCHLVAVKILCNHLFLSVWSFLSWWAKVVYNRQMRPRVHRTLDRTNRRWAIRFNKLHGAFLLWPYNKWKSREFCKDKKQTKIAYSHSMSSLSLFAIVWIKKSESFLVDEKKAHDIKSTISIFIKMILFL